MTIRYLPGKIISLSVALMLCNIAYSQITDTLHITIENAEKRFLEKNLILLAEQYNISRAKAQLIQAKLYSNSNLSFTGNIYNPEQKKSFDVTNRTGEYIIEAQQLIRLAGKRNKEIRLAETNITQSENRFFDLLRTLRFSLRSNFFNALFLQNSIKAFDNQISSLERLNAAYQDLQAKGIVTLKDAVRIRSLLYSLKAEQASLQNQLNDLQADLQLLLQNNKGYVVPVADNNAIAALRVSQLNLQSLIDSAYANRSDLKLASANILFNQRNYDLQKALATPDLIVGAQFDKRGSFVENASFFRVAMDLPFRNRNQGNIKAAKVGIEQSKLQYNYQQQLVENEVQKAYVRALNTEKMLQSIDPQFTAQFNRLLQGVTENFQKKNISLLEFTDFYESYKNNILQFNQLQNERMQALEALQFAAGSNIFNL